MQRTDLAFAKVILTGKAEESLRSQRSHRVLRLALSVHCEAKQLLGHVQKRKKDAWGVGSSWVCCQSQSMAVVVVPLCFLLVASRGQTLFGHPILGATEGMQEHKVASSCIKPTVLTCCSRRDGILMSGKREGFLRRA